MKKTSPELNDARPRRKLRAGHIILAMLAAGLIALIAAALVSVARNGILTVKNYTVESEKLQSGFRIVLMSDLHRAVFGEDNGDLVSLVAAQEPDLIILDGDMIEGDHTEEEADALIYLLERLVEIAPVYYAQGNHDAHLYSESVEYNGEVYIRSYGRSAFLDRIESTGTVFLEYAYRDIEVNGDSIRIGGYYPYAWKTEAEPRKEWKKRSAFLEDFCSAESFKLMLSHRPDTFIYEDAGSAWDIDLVLSGHTHNGVIALPFGLGAVWCSEGLFPEHDSGEFDLGSMKMIISAGLAGWRFLPRVFNPPEIDVIDLVPLNGGA